MNDKTNEKADAHPSDLKPDTLLSVGGRDPFAHHGYVNPPVYHASTLLYRTAEDFLARRGRYRYGRRGTPTSEALENALRELKGPKLRRGRAHAIGAFGDLDRPARGAAHGRPCARHRQRLRTDAQILRGDAHPARRHHDLL